MKLTTKVLIGAALAYAAGAVWYRQTHMRRMARPADGPDQPPPLKEVLLWPMHLPGPFAG